VVRKAPAHSGLTFAVPDLRALVPRESAAVFDSVLIANRGEIAVRIARGCRELGIRTIAVYSEPDRDALHVRACDEAYLLGPADPAASYLDIDRIIEVVRRSGASAVHPGYGFLAENAAFARAVADAGAVFIGPSPEAIERMGDKLSARAVARAADVPVVPGTVEPTSDAAVAKAFGEEHGYPVAVKAMFGGGGRGMKVVRDPDEMEAALASAAREAGVAFGRSECYLERYLERPRHVEVQILGDHDGTVVHLGDRDCSLQRRHQKLVEEAPAPGIDPEVRAAIHDAAIRVSREMHYVNAGTCEFLLDEDGRSFYFLEMNTRLQVEHPVTELVTGVDLVHAQLRIAAGEGIGFGQDDVVIRGHAIEARINAEDPGAGFVPSPGTVSRLEPPLGPGIRLDTGLRSGSVIAREYDSMVAKLVVWGEHRDVACERLLVALDELVVEGIPTTVPFHRLAVQHPAFRAVEHATSSVEREWDLSSLVAVPVAVETDQQARRREELVTVEVNDRRFEVRVHAHVRSARRAKRPIGSSRPSASAAGASGEVLAPMQGTIIGYSVEPGARVAPGDPIVTLEAMKMENTLRATVGGTVIATGVAPGTVVQPGALLATIDPD
jgi:acetyl-CoA/propionyl-CoA carboxylase biotin carboxyl carrier protein